MAGLLLLGGVARADPLAAASLPVCTLAPDAPQRLVIEPCRPAPPPRRRAVPQTIQRMPRQPVPAASLPAPAPAAVTVPGTPLPLNGCDSGGCRDAAGVRHEGGVGNATLDRNGRLCNREGAWLQCY